MAMKSKPRVRRVSQYLEIINFYLNVVCFQALLRIWLNEFVIFWFGLCFCVCFLFIKSRRGRVNARFSVMITIGAII